MLHTIIVFRKEPPLLRATAPSVLPVLSALSVLGFPWHHSLYHHRGRGPRHWLFTRLLMRLFVRLFAHCLSFGSFGSFGSVGPSRSFGPFRTVLASLLRDHCLDEPHGLDGPDGLH
jgi:hypothetical protein